MTNQTKNYCLTIFDSNELNNLKHETIQYSAYGEETCPTTQRKHYQTFVVFKTKRRFLFVKTLFPSSHIEPMKGSFLSNEKYCSKEGTLIEYGEKPMDQKTKGEKGKEYWDEQLKLAREDPEKCDSKLQITHTRNLQLIHTNFKRKQHFEQLDTLQNEWFVGDSGTGKSSTARKENPNAYIKQCNKWFNDYDYQETIIIDDLDTQHEYMAYFINQWADHYPFPAETKGGQITIRPKKIIITSRYTADNIFKDCSTIESINRRFKYRHFQSTP